MINICNPFKGCGRVFFSVMRSWNIYTKTVTALFTFVVIVLIFKQTDVHQAGDIPPYRLPPTNGNSSQGDFKQRLTTLYNGVETFVLFIGHARSGHSLIGAILDAHPVIIIPHEWDAITKWDHYKNRSIDDESQVKTRLFFDLHSLSRSQAMFGNRAPTGPKGDRYSYYVPGQWQGTYRGKIKVIGDKKGTTTSRTLRNPQNFKLLEEIEATLETQLKFIHVIRNPFDNIATKLLRNLDARGMARDKQNFKANNSTLLDELITNYFANVKSAETLHQYGKYEVLDIYSHEVVSRPRQNLQKLCDFLEVTCDEDYLNACSELLYSKPSLTRHSIGWTNEQKRRVSRLMRKYKFMRPFTFDGII